MSDDISNIGEFLLTLGLVIVKVNNKALTVDKEGDIVCTLSEGLQGSSHIDLI